MPSAEETTFVFKVMPETTQDFLTRDVDLLVSQIKENLRLSGLKAKSSVTLRHRSSPYLMPSRAELRRAEAACKQKNKDKDEDDPYEKLRELLKQGRLINEAVKKLKAMNVDELSNSDDDGEIDDVHGIRFYRRKTYYYDSEDEPLPAVYDPDSI